MRISDWSSDVCSSDLLPHPVGPGAFAMVARVHDDRVVDLAALLERPEQLPQPTVDVAQAVVIIVVEAVPALEIDRKSVVSGKGVSVRVDLGGRRIIKKKKSTNNQQGYNA